MITKQTIKEALKGRSAKQLCYHHQVIFRDELDRVFIAEPEFQSDVGIVESYPIKKTLKETLAFYDMVNDVKKERDQLIDLAHKIVSFIKHNKIDASQVPMSTIIEQYFSTLDKMYNSDGFKQLVYNLLVQNLKKGQE